MGLESGAMLGHYQIEALLGAGGMGQVYRARDTKLGRDVAIKVLPEEFAQDEERLRRFRREAKVLASLNHPNIASIYGLEQSEATHYLVLELVPGETLADRIARGPISLEEALAIAVQIVEALEEAHERGIVHRDLKPANIKITPDDKIKVLDFGLAKAVAEEDSEADAVTSMSPTLTRDATRIGVILGTASYMSPEQAKGKRVDKRTDVFAFGAVLYEMLTARKAFPGDEVSEVLAAVIKSDPDWSRLPAGVPASIQRVLRRSLEKDPKRRLPDIAVARLEIDEDAGEVGEPLQTPRRQMVPWALAALSAAAAAIALWTGQQLPTASPVRVLVGLPAGQELSLGEQGVMNPIALSPDGRHLVYAAAERGSRTTRLFLRPLDQFVSRPIDGTEGAAAPFFSADGRWIGFFTSETIQKVSVSGGLPVKVCDTSVLLPSASWGSEDTIVFSHFNLGLHKVSASGGTPESLTLPDASKGEFRHFAPQILPGGRDVLFTVASTEGFVTALVSLVSNERRTMLDDAEGARYVQSGHLVYGRSGTLFAIPFDLSRMETHGTPVPLLERVSHLAGLGSAHFAASVTGTLVYPAANAGSASTTLAWVDREGRATPIVDEPAPHSNPRLSPDGRLIAVSIGADIWVYDVESGTRRRLTTDGYNLVPTWHPDGDRVTFSAVRADPEALFDLHSVPVDRSTGPKLLLRREGRQFPFSWSPDGTILSFMENTAAGGDISILEGESVSHFLAGSYHEVSPAFSPDGRWLAYESDETGRPEVYVTRYPGPADTQPISVNGGREPLWSRDGRELFYYQGDLLVAVPVESADSTFKTETARVLFEVPYTGLDRGGMGYDVAPDGERFVMLQLSDTTATSRINVVLNWWSELERLVPAVK